MQREPKCWCGHFMWRHKKDPVRLVWTCFGCLVDARYGHKHEGSAA